MVQIGIAIVYADCINPENLHQCCVAETGVLVRQSILSRCCTVARATAWLVCDTNDLKAVSRDIVDKVIARHSNCRNC